MDLYEQFRSQCHRRTFLGRTSLGVGAAALSSITGGQTLHARSTRSNVSVQPGVEGLPHFAARA